jgi:hypothetical protein
MFFLNSWCFTQTILHMFSVLTLMSNASHVWCAINLPGKRRRFGHWRLCVPLTTRFSSLECAHEWFSCAVWATAKNNFNTFCCLWPQPITSECTMACFQSTWNPVLVARKSCIHAGSCSSQEMLFDSTIPGSHVMLAEVMVAKKLCTVPENSWMLLPSTSEVTLLLLTIVVCTTLTITWTFIYDNYKLWFFLLWVSSSQKTVRNNSSCNYILWHVIFLGKLLWYELVSQWLQVESRRHHSCVLKQSF